MGADFAPPNWHAQLNLFDLYARIPEDATVKGMFFQDPISQAARVSGKRPGRDKYIGFKNYPLREHVEVLVACAKLAHPDQPVREGIRRLGHTAYSTFASSMVGRTVLGIAGRNWDAALNLVTRAYNTTGPVGSAAITERHGDSVVVHLRDIWNLADCYHVGIFEEAMKHYGKHGEVWLRAHSWADVELKLVLR